MTTAPQEPRQEAQFFTTIRNWGVVRGDEGLLGGVAQGVGDRVGMDKLPARLILVVGAIFLTPIALLGYAASWALLPDSQGNIIIQNFGRGRPNVGALIGIALLTLMGATISDESPWLINTGHRWGSVVETVWTLLLLGGIVGFILWLVNRRRHSDGPRASQVPENGEPPVYAAVPPGTVAATKTTSDEPAPTADTATQQKTRTSGSRRVASASASVAADTEQPPSTSTMATQPRPVAPRPRTPGPGRAIYLLLLALTVTTAALVWWFERENRLEVDPTVAFFAVLVIIVGAGIVIAGATGRRVGFLGFAATVLILGWSITLVIPGASAWLNDRVNLTFSGEPIIEATLSDEQLADRAFRCTDFDHATADTIRAAAEATVVDATGSGKNVFVGDPYTVITVSEGAFVEFDVENSISSGEVLWEEAGVRCKLEFEDDTLTIGDGHTNVRVVISHPSAQIVIEEG